MVADFGSGISQSVVWYVVSRRAGLPAYDKLTDSLAQALRNLGLCDAEPYRAAVPGSTLRLIAEAGGCHSLVHATRLLLPEARAIPFIMLFLLGVVLLRGAGDKAALTKAA